MKDFLLIFLAALALGYFSLLLPGGFGVMPFAAAVIAVMVALLQSIYFRLLAIEKKLDQLTKEGPAQNGAGRGEELP